MKYLCLCCVLLLTACVEQNTIPSGYYPNPQRFILEHSHQRSDWQQPQQTYLPGKVASQEAFLYDYFAATDFNVPEQGWSTPIYPNSVFAKRNASLSLFEADLPLSAELQPQYRKYVEACESQTTSLKYQLDEQKLLSQHSYLGAFANDNLEWQLGVVLFFSPLQRPRLSSGELIYGVVTQYLQTDNTDAGIATQMSALLYNDTQRLFYLHAERQFWLAGIAQPGQRATVAWEGGQKKYFEGVEAIGGSCGSSVRTWLKQKYSVQSAGYYHLGYGKVRYDQNQKPVALSDFIAFDAQRAQALIFEPQPRLNQADLAEYLARIQVLQAKQQPLLSAFDQGRLKPEQDYIAASRGSQALSHTGIVRFYPHQQRPRDSEGRMIYGEFIHNWNPKRKRGPMTISGLLQDEKSGVLYWQEEGVRQMWIYGVGEPAEPTRECNPSNSAEQECPNRLASTAAKQAGAW